MPTLSLPYQATIRTYQKDLWESLYTKKRGFFFIHRRAGKDFVCVNILTREAIKRVGVYYYLFPTYEQARKVIWEGITNDGRKFIDMFPPELVAKRNEQQMSIELINGSVIRLIGTDRYDAIRGTNPVGCVFSEFAFQNPMAWDIIRPILRANGGWAIFITTPNGENHAWELYERIKDNPKWASQLLTIEDTGALTEEDIQEERDSGMSEAMVRQEYYCDPFALQDGVVYGKEIKLLGDRVGDVAFDPLLPVQTFWDLGRNDLAVVWFAQIRGDRINLIDYYENAGDWVGDWIKMLKEKPYTYSPLGLPHDAFAKRNEAKESIAGQFEEAGFKVKRIPAITIANGISAVRRLFPRFHFDKTKCSQGLTMLKSYQYEFDPLLKKFKHSPKHDIYSHTCLSGETEISTTAGQEKLKNIKKGDYVCLGDIKARVTCAKKTGYKKVYLLEFESGNKIKTTQDHKFFTQRGLVRADALRYNDCVHTLAKPIWKLSDFKSIGIKRGITLSTKESNIEFGRKDKWQFPKLVAKLFLYIEFSVKKSLAILKDLKYTQRMGTVLTLGLKTWRKEQGILKENFVQNTLFKSLKELSFTGQKKDIFTKGIKADTYIGWFGKVITDLFRQICTFITLTTTKLIMIFQTYSLSPQANMLSYQLLTTNGLEAQKIKSNSTRLGKKQRLGIQLDRARNGTVSMANLLGNTSKALRQFAGNVAKIIKHTFLQGLNGVEGTVKLEQGDRLVSVKYSGFEDVYDITVEKHHAYLANGILVSNCDALRYLAVGIEELSKEDDYDKMVAEYLRPKNEMPELGVKIDEFADYEKSLKQYLR